MDKSRFTEKNTFFKSENMIHRFRSASLLHFLCAHTLDSPRVQIGSIMPSTASEFSNEIGDNSFNCQNCQNFDSGSEVFFYISQGGSLRIITAFQLEMIS